MTDITNMIFPSYNFLGKSEELPDSGNTGDIILIGDKRYIYCSGEYQVLDIIPEYPMEEIRKEVNRAEASKLKDTLIKIFKKYDIM